MQVYVEKKYKDPSLYVSYQEASSDPCKQGSILSPSHPRDALDDSSVPIALRKGIHSYNKYPLSNFVTYISLLPFFLSFVFALSSIFMSHNVSEGLS